MKGYTFLVTLLLVFQNLLAEEVRLLDLEPTDAQQVIEKQDTNLNYAPKIETNVPAVRFLGNEPHHVLEDIYSARQYHGQDGLGGYLYGYNVPDIAKTERKKAGGDLRGAYNYIAGNGQEIKVEYWDDGTGFHQIDNVPKVLPQQIDDSPEVKAAKEKFLARWHEEAERNTHPVANPYDNEGNYASGPLSPQAQIQQQQQQYALQQQQNQKPGYGLNQYQNQQSQTQFQQPGQYQQNVNSNNYQQQRPQYPQQSQFQNQYQQQQPQYQQQQQPQYQQQQQPQYQHQQQQHQPLPTQNQVDYTGQYSENKDIYSVNPNTYKVQPQTSQGQSSSQYSSHKPEEEEDTGAYDKKYDDEEPHGPPKGFFYSFDYPVGIIVNKEGVAKDGVKDVYDQNKAKFEAQLQSGHTDGGSQSGYLYVKNQ